MRSSHVSLGSTGTWKTYHYSNRQPQLYKSEEKMGRQGENTCNTTKSNTTPLKTREPATARLEKPNIDEVE